MLRIVNILLLLSAFKIFALQNEDLFEVELKLFTQFFSPEISRLDISNWQNPTWEDYDKLQNFIKERKHENVNRPESERPFTTEVLNREFYGWLTYRNARIGFVKKRGEEIGRHIFYGSSNPKQRERCIICYAGTKASGNTRDYQRGVNYIIEALKKINFDGHFIYYIGGWPGLARDRLKFADVPFSFKPFLFEEARDMGYKQILWLDACCVPVKNLDPIFQLIKRQGLCFYSYGSIQSWRPFLDGYKYLMPYLEISENKGYEQISSQVVGLDMSNREAVKLLEEWISAAERKVPFLQSDEPPFMYLVNHLNLEYGRMPQEFYVETPCGTGKFDYWRQNSKAIIYHQYDFLDPKYELSVDLWRYKTCD